METQSGRYLQLGMGLDREREGGGVKKMFLVRKEKVEEGEKKRHLEAAPNLFDP